MHKIDFYMACTFFRYSINDIILASIYFDVISFQPTLISLQLHWAKDATKRYSHSDLPRDLTVLEEVIREHNESWLETKGNVQR